MKENKRKLLFNLLLILTIAAVFIGTYYYLSQLFSTSPNLLIFVPDCPLYVLLAIPILLKLINSPSYSFFTAIGMAKYGLWTVFILLFHWDYYSLPDMLPVTVIFIIGHIGMALLGAALLPKKKIALPIVLLALAWFLLNDISDYFWGTVPQIPKAGLELVAFLTFLASIVITLGFFAWRNKIRKFAPVKFFRGLIQN